MGKATRDSIADKNLTERDGTRLVVDKPRRNTFSILRQDQSLAMRRTSISELVDGSVPSALRTYRSGNRRPRSPNLWRLSDNWERAHCIRPTKKPRKKAIAGPINETTTQKGTMPRLIVDGFVWEFSHGKGNRGQANLLFLSTFSPYSFSPWMRSSSGVRFGVEVNRYLTALVLPQVGQGAVPVPLRVLR